MDSQNYYGTHYPQPQPPDYGNPGKGKKKSKATAAIIIGFLIFMVVSAALILIPTFIRNSKNGRVILNEEGNQITIDENKSYVFIPQEDGYYSFTSLSGSGLRCDRIYVNDERKEPFGMIESNDCFSITDYCSSGDEIKLDLYGKNGTVYIRKTEPLTEGKNDVSAFTDGTIFPIDMSISAKIAYTVASQDSEVTAASMIDGKVGDDGYNGSFTYSSTGSCALVLSIDGKNATVATVTLNEAEDLTVGTDMISSGTTYIFNVPASGYYYFSCDAKSGVTVGNNKINANYYTHDSYTLDCACEYSYGDEVFITSSSSAEIEIKSISESYYNAYTDYCSYLSDKITIYNDEMLYTNHTYSTDASNKKAFSSTQTMKPAGFYYDETSGRLWLAFGMTISGSSILAWYPV